MKKHRKGWAWYLPVCQRCKERTWYLKASMFNNQKCCKACIMSEKRLRIYDQVRNEVIEELFKGTNKFPDYNIFRTERSYSCHYLES